MNNEIKYFRFDMDNTILIYGAGSMGIIVYDICKELKIKVLGFLDKRSDEISELHRLKVWNVNDNEVDAIDKNCIVFIAVKNVFEHDNIARALIDKGFNNIIYRPYDVLKGGGNVEGKQIFEAYDRFMNKELVKNDIPKTFEVYQYEYKDYSTIRKLENERIVYVPIEIVFTDIDHIESERNWAEDIPVMTLVPHIGLFRWIDQQPGFSFDNYITLCINYVNKKGKIEATERWKENVIKNRVDVYYNMNESLERDFDFFIRNAPAAKWNCKGHFNLMSGKHRAAFLIAKGRRYIPLKISEQDFTKWIDQLKVDKMIEQLDSLNVYDVKAPVEHPYFYNMSCENKNLYYKLLCEFIFKIAKEQFERLGYIRLNEMLKVIVSLNDDGYTARTLSRFGIDVEVYNKSTISNIFDELVERSDKNNKNYSCYCVFAEYNYGTQIDLGEILDRSIKYAVCLVKVRDCVEFENTMNDKYSVTNCRYICKDAEIAKVYWLEDNEKCYME